MRIHEVSENDPACPKEVPNANHKDECKMPFGTPNCVYPKEGESVQDNISATALSSTALEKRPGISIEKAKMELAIVDMMAMIPNVQKMSLPPTWSINVLCPNL